LRLGEIYVSDDVAVDPSRFLVLTVVRSVVHRVVL